MSMPSKIAKPWILAKEDDAFTAAMVMMMSALSLLVWRPLAQLGAAIRLPRLRKP